MDKTDLWTQIKNSVRTAIALAGWKNETLSTKLVETVVVANEAFEEDYKGVGPIENMKSYA